MELTNINDIRALLERHGFHFSKSLGQNFLCASWVPEDTAALCGADSSCGVLEVGAGVGCLTRELSLRAKRVVCVELDKALAPVLAETLGDRDNVEIVYADIMKTDIPALVREKFADCERVKVCANLPYNITTPVLTAFVEAGCFDSITVMLQREAAKRICAGPKSEDYGVFSILMQWHTEPRVAFDVPPHCFIPAPKVTSSVIHMPVRKAPPFDCGRGKVFFSIVRAAFAMRRKTLYNALGSGLGGQYDKEQIAAAMDFCGLDPRVRGEALSIAQFAALSKALSEV